jgi:hypothetical protein
MHEQASSPITVPVAKAREISGLGNTKIYELIRSGELKSTLACVASCSSPRSAICWNAEHDDMNHNELTPEAVYAARGPGSVFDARRNSPGSTLTAAPIEALATVLLARRYRLPPVLARLVVELAGIGGRLA